MKGGHTPAFRLGRYLRCWHRRGCRVRGRVCYRRKALSGAAAATSLPARIWLTIADHDAAGRSLHAGAVRVACSLTSRATGAVSIWVMPSSVATSSVRYS